MFHRFTDHSSDVLSHRVPSSQVSSGQTVLSSHCLQHLSMARDQVPASACQVVARLHHADAEKQCKTKKMEKVQISYSVLINDSFEKIEWMESTTTINHSQFGQEYGVESFNIRWSMLQLSLASSQWFAICPSWCFSVTHHASRLQLWEEGVRAGALQQGAVEVQRVPRNMGLFAVSSVSSFVGMTSGLQYCGTLQFQGSCFDWSCWCAPVQVPQRPSSTLGLQSKMWRCVK